MVWPTTNNTNRYDYTYATWRKLQMEWGEVVSSDPSSDIKIGVYFLGCSFPSAIPKSYRPTLKCAFAHMKLALPAWRDNPTIPRTSISPIP